MKRRASRPSGYEQPPKLVKDSTSANVGETLSTLMRADTPKKPALQPARWPSVRERKAPAWMSSYVTKSTPKEPPKPKLAMPKFPTLVPPSKAKPQKVGANVKEKAVVQETKKEMPVSLRRQSTVKVEDSPPLPSKSKSFLVNSASLARKSTEIINSSDFVDSSGDLAETVNGGISARKKKTATADKKSLSSTSSKSSKENAEKLKLQQSVPSTKSSSSKSVSLKASLSKPSLKSNAKSSIRVFGTEASDSDVFEVFDTDNSSSGMGSNMVKKHSSIFSFAKNDTIPLGEKPKMLEVVICISTSGALREYLLVLQEKIREIVWRMQSLVPNLRIGVMAHTQGGIHDDNRGSSSGDHNYNRMGGHSGTKWLDLGATLSQICAFVDSLEPEPTVYPDYVQDNLEMALWKLQRCMTWSSCSYRTVVMIGRGRPNRTSFYLQKEHWRGWIRTALELTQKQDIPIIDWELEAKLLAQMGIHVFALQAVSDESTPSEEDEGTAFFRRVAEITNAQHIRLPSPEKLYDILISICCACHSPDLLQIQRDSVRDDNDGLLPSQLTNVFMGLQLHSKTSSLSILPSLMGHLNLASFRSKPVIPKLQNFEKMDTFEEEEEEEEDNNRGKKGGEKNLTKVKEKEKGRKVNSQGLSKGVKKGRVEKNEKVAAVKKKKIITAAVKTIQKAEKEAKEEEKRKKKVTPVAENGVKKGTNTSKVKASEKMGLKGGKVEKAKNKRGKAAVVNKKAVAAVVSKQRSRKATPKQRTPVPKRSTPSKVLAKVKSITKKAKETKAKNKSSKKTNPMKSTPSVKKSPAKVAKQYKSVTPVAKRKATVAKNKPQPRPKVAKSGLKVKGTAGKGKTGVKNAVSIKLSNQRKRATSKKEGKGSKTITRTPLKTKK